MWGIMEVSENKNLFTNITGVKNVATTIALTTKKDTIVVTKSTVPSGTNGRLRQIIDHNKLYHILNKIYSYLSFIVIAKSKKVNQFHLQRFIWKWVKVVD